MNLLPSKSRIKIFMGEYGSGKTEISANYALAAKSRGMNTAIVDFDLIKPYFRTRENQNYLEQKGIKVILPASDFVNTDLPIMPQNFIRILYDKQYQVIIDVGGGETAVVLGQIKQHFTDNGYEAFLVINTCRPFSNNAKEIVDRLQLIEQVSRLKISGLISNTNLAADTEIENILAGLQITEIVSKMADIPICFVAVPFWLNGKITLKYPMFMIEPITHYPWMD